MTDEERAGILIKQLDLLRDMVIRARKPMGILAHTQHRAIILQAIDSIKRTVKNYDAALKKGMQ